jgi:flagellar hook-basal body complex protein FliE
MAINSIQALNGINAYRNQASQTGSSEGFMSFGDYLKDAVSKANDLGLQSEKLADEFAAGNTDNIHEVMIAAEKADIALQFIMQVRNKILDAYSEIMRMQI